MQITSLRVVTTLFIVGGFWLVSGVGRPAPRAAPATPSPATGAAKAQSSSASPAPSTAARPAAGERVGVGTRAPELRAVTIDGSESVVTLAAYSGEVVLLYVFATWCPYCKDEMPSIERVHREFASSGLRVIAVSKTGSDKALRDFAWERGYTFPILRDDRESTHRAYGVSGYPRTFIIDRDGVIRGEQFGYSPANYDENVAVIRQLVND